MQRCEFSSLCPPAAGSKLNACPHYAGTEKQRQPPPTSSFALDIGFVQRWDPLIPGTNTTDVAAAFMDDDTVEGNGSLAADRVLEMWRGAFTGQEASPIPNTTVTIISMVDPHIVHATVVATNQNEVASMYACRPNQLDIPLISQTELEVTQGPCFTAGDSGSLVLNQNGDIVGMFNWADLDNPCLGGGTNATAVRTTLGFDRWYGPNVNDQIVGVFRPSTLKWMLDNGNGKSDTPRKAGGLMSGAASKAVTRVYSA